MGGLHLAIGFTPHILEAIGVTANVWGMLLIRKQNIFGWVSGLIAMICIGIFSVQMQIYGQAFLQLGFFLPSTLYALYLWRRHAQSSTPAHWLTSRGRLYAICAFLVMLAGMMIFVESPHGTLLRLFDVVGVTFVMTGHMLMVLKKKDCWPFFFPGNLLTIYLFTVTGGYMVALLNVFFLINGLKAFWEWTADDRATKAVSSS